MGEYQLRDYCKCGWSTIPAFGDKWYSDSDYPICPNCGADCTERELVKGKIVPPQGNWFVRNFGGWKFMPASQAKE